MSEIVIRACCGHIDISDGEGGYTVPNTPEVREKVIPELLRAMEAKKEGAPIRVFHEGKELALKAGGAWPWQEERFDATNFAGFDEGIVSIQSRAGWFRTADGSTFDPSTSFLVVVPSERAQFHAYVAVRDPDGYHGWRSNGGPKPWESAPEIKPLTVRPEEMEFLQTTAAQDALSKVMEDMGLPADLLAPPKKETWRDRDPLL